MTSHNRSSEVYDTSAESLSTGKSSTSTLKSVLSVSTLTSKKVKNAAKKKSMLEKRKEKKRLKKIEKNKIDKDDFYSKHAEFRTWLWEQKGIKFETLSAAKAKEHFKKFTKKWNSKKLPKAPGDNTKIITCSVSHIKTSYYTAKWILKDDIFIKDRHRLKQFQKSNKMSQQYYRGIDTCWFDGSPATQSLWAMPKQIEMTPGSLREEALEQRYSRQPTHSSPLGTFGKQTGRKALQELQRLYPDTFRKPMRSALPSSKECENVDSQQPPQHREVKKTSSSSLPESFTRPPRPAAPKRSSSLTNMITTDLTAVFEDDLNDNTNSATEIRPRSSSSLCTVTKKRSTSSKCLFDVSPNKLKKEDSYSEKERIERVSPSVFKALRINSSKKKKLASVKQRPKSLCDSRVFESIGQSQKLSRCGEDSFRKSAVLSLVDGVCTPSKW